MLEGQYCDLFLSLGIAVDYLLRMSHLHQTNLSCLVVALPPTTPQIASKKCFHPLNQIYFIAITTSTLSGAAERLQQGWLLKMPLNPWVSLQKDSHQKIAVKSNVNCVTLVNLKKGKPLGKHVEYPKTEDGKIPSHLPQSVTMTIIDDISFSGM